MKTICISVPFVLRPSIRSLMGAVFAVSLVSLSGCLSGGGSGGDGPGDEPGIQLISIAITANISIPAGNTQQQTATGTYSDSSTGDITTTVVWSSSDEAVAIVSNSSGTNGLVTGIAVGTAVISANLGGFNASTNLTVTPPELISIEVFPSDLSVAIGVPQQFVALGSYTDSSVQVITASVTWNSADPGVMVVSNDLGTEGSGITTASGISLITATLDSASGSTNLTVLPIQALDFYIPNTKALGLPVTGIDSTGNALFAWEYQFAIPGELYTASFDGVGWEPKALLDTTQIADRTFIPKLAVNSNGGALIAWSGQSGLYASQYIPGSGWQTPKVVDSGASPFLVFANSVQLAIDSAGNGFLVWANDNGDQVFSSQHDVSTDSWTTPQLITPDRGLARSALAFALNSATGESILLWEYWDFGASPGWTLYASNFISGEGAGTGWQSPVALYSSDSYHNPQVAANDNGVFVATWLDNVSLFPNRSLYASRFISGDGWQTTNEVSYDDPNMPADPKVAINSSGNAVIVWRNGYDKSIAASRYIVGSGWQGVETLRTFPPSGDPTVLEPHMDAQGKILTMWITESLSVPDKVEFRRFLPASGWQDIEPLLYIEHKGQLGGISIDINSNGVGVIVWEESYTIFDGEFFNTFTDIYASTDFSF